MEDSNNMITDDIIEQPNSSVVPMTDEGGERPPISNSEQSFVNAFDHEMQTETAGVQMPVVLDRQQRPPPTEPDLVRSVGGLNPTLLLSSLRLEDKVLQKIDHSIKFIDNYWEYRFVVLPRTHPLFDPLLLLDHFSGFMSAFAPEQTIGSTLADLVRDRVLTEGEWRAIGIRQTRGWQHCGYSPHESNVLLFRRALGTDPRSGKLSSERKKELEEYDQVIAQKRAELQAQRRDELAAITGGVGSAVCSVPFFGGQQLAATAGAAELPLTMSPGGNVAATLLHNPAQIPEPRRTGPGPVLARLMTAATKYSLDDKTILKQPNSDFFDGEETPVIPWSEASGTSRKDLLAQLDWLTARRHFPLFGCVR